MAMPDATHMLDFGPGRTAGVAGLTSRIKDGTGARVILATNITNPTHPEIGCKHEIFARHKSDLVYGTNWDREFGPRLIKTSAGQTFVDTKMSRLLGLRAGDDEHLARVDQVRVADVVDAGQLADRDSVVLGDLAQRVTTLDGVVEGEDRGEQDQREACGQCADAAAR